MKLTAALLGPLVGALLLLFSGSTASAQRLAAETVTVMIGGYSPAGLSTVGTFGEDGYDPLIGQLAGLLGAPTMLDSGGLDAPNLVTGCEFYGDVAPSYYTPVDVAELDALKVQYGGGIPVYAMIVAKFARHVLARTGAEQVNLIGPSMGAYITRWLLEKDYEGLASEGRVARWLTYEGVVAGNWGASQPGALNLASLLPTLPIDVLQMDYAWFEANLHAPRGELDNSLFAGIQIGHNSSVRDTAGGGVLTAALYLLLGAYRPNDGVVLVEDGHFSSVTPVSRYLGQLPSYSYADVDHYQAATDDSIPMHAASLILGSRRVTVRLERARVFDLKDSGPFGSASAEVVFESRAEAPWIAANWGLVGALSTLGQASGVSPLWSFPQTGVWQTLDLTLFDDFVPPAETQLSLRLGAHEVDIDPKYGMLELFGSGGFTPYGEGDLIVSTETPGNYTFQAQDWEAELVVSLDDVPNELPLYFAGGADFGATSTPLAGAAVSMELHAGPNQAGDLYFVFASLSGTQPGTPTAGGLVPLNWDSYSSFALVDAGSALHQAFAGQLDARGQAQPVFNSAAQALPAAALGLELNFAALALDASGAITRITNAISLTVSP